MKWGVRFYSHRGWGKGVKNFPPNLKLVKNYYLPKKYSDYFARIFNSLFCNYYSFSTIIFINITF